MNAIEIKGLRKQYGGFTLGGLDFTLPEGCITGLVGENGAGKSTLLRLIVGMTRPDAGELRVLGAPVGGEAFRALREDIGYVPDETYFPEMLTPRDVGAVLSRAYSRWDASSYAALLERFALPVRKPVRELSRGMKMKLSLAAALAHRPRLLVLDEATGGLDPVARDGILDLLNDFTRDETHTVLLSSHILSDLEKICDYVAFLRNGRLLFCEEKDRLTECCAVVRLPAREIGALPENAVLARRRNGLAAELLVRRDALPRGFTAGRTTLEEIVLLLSASAETKEEIV